MPMSSPSGVRRPFVVMAKPAGSACNMRCAYCYYLHNPASSPGGVMSPETLESLIRTTIAASPGPVVSIVWHGGEPMLAGLDFYRRIAKEAPAHLLPGGALILEIGAGEGERVREMLKENGAVRVGTEKDFSGIERMILAEY